MNLIRGKHMDSDQANEEIVKIQESTLKSLAGGKLPREDVIAACDALSEKLNEQIYLPMLVSTGMNPEKAKSELDMVRLLLSRAYLESRIEREFGEWTERSFHPAGYDRLVRQTWEPLGVLLHIAAGNVDALPAFSVIEGLLTENVNILKLPGGGDELSIRVLMELITIEPRIAEKVFVFDVSSNDIAAMGRLADAADAIVIWGGDAAVRAVRQMAKPDTRVIEWGHKISFAYISGSEWPDNELRKLAKHICETNQLFCSACQGIFLDTDSFETVVEFAGRFAEILEETAKSDPLPVDPFRTAQTTIALYTKELEAVCEEKRVFRNEHCGVIATCDCELTPSYMFRNVWVKPLLKERILPALKPYKNHLQTAALICGPALRGELESALVTAGVVRVTSGENMSEQYCGMPHDGEFALRRYMKIVSLEN